MGLEVPKVLPEPSQKQTRARDNERTMNVGMPGTSGRSEQWGRTRKPFISHDGLVLMEPAGGSHFYSEITA
jgi:hypothetical protein